MDSAEIYDPATDTLTALEPMESPHAFAQVVALDADTFFIGTGLDEGGDASDETDVFLMQNWAHLLHIMQQLNRAPTDSHGADFGRVRLWCVLYKGVR